MGKPLYEYRFSATFKRKPMLGDTFYQHNGSVYLTTDINRAIVDYNLEIYYEVGPDSVLFPIKVTPLKLYHALAKQLDVAIESCGIESDEAEAMRCRMDEPWKLLTEQQQNEARKV
jgi:hypothetical protein